MTVRIEISNQSGEVIDFIYNNWISLGLLFIAGGGVFTKIIRDIIITNKPVIKDHKSIIRYIDYERNCHIEEIEYLIFWGLKFFKTKSTTLPEINSNVQFKLEIKPITSFRTELTRDFYDDTSDGPS